MNKSTSRTRRARKSRSKIARLKTHRLCVHRTPRHIYAQIIVPAGHETIASASSLEADVRGGVKYTGNMEAAKLVGTMIAERARDKGVHSVSFDRSGFKYHGRVQALADAARAAGLKF